MTTLTPLTSEYAKRVNNSLFETQSLLDKELSYSKDLQNVEYVNELKSHIAKLNNMLLNGWNTPKFN